MRPSSAVRRLRSDDAGFSLIEMAVVALVGAILLLGVGNFLVSSMSAGAFTEGQGATLNDVRNVMQKIEKEARGAASVTWCDNDGTCLEVGAQTPTGGFQTVRYVKTGNALTRAVFDDDTSSWGDPSTMVERLTNTASQPVFSCDTQSTLLRVNIDLYVEPTPDSDPILHVHTSIRPRNFPEKATCP